LDLLTSDFDIRFSDLIKGGLVRRLDLTH